MNATQLIEMLKELPGDADVRIAQPTHDHWHSVVAKDIRTCDEEMVKHSSYHDAMVIDDDGEKTVYVLC